MKRQGVGGDASPFFLLAIGVQPSSRRGHSPLRLRGARATLLAVPCAAGLHRASSTYKLTTAAEAWFGDDVLSTRPLPAFDDDERFTHIHELVESSAGREIARVTELMLHALSQAEQQDMYARFSKLERSSFFANPLWPPRGSWFKHLQHVGNCWEVGNDDRLRFYGFRHGDLLVLVTGSKKRGKKTPKDVLGHCMTMRDRFKAQVG